MVLSTIIILSRKTEEFKKQFTCLGKHTEKKCNLRKNLGEIIKNIHLAYCSSSIAQDLWQVHYQILSIIFLEEFLELNVNSNPFGVQECETCGIKYKYCNCFQEYRNFKDDL